MAEYIDRENIIPHSIDDDYEEGGERLIVDYKDIEEMTLADVVERAEYEELNDKYLKAIHNHTECLKELHELRSKIDKSIKEMNCIDLNEYADNTYQLVNECIEILKKNIGE